MKCCPIAVANASVLRASISASSVM